MNPSWVELFLHTWLAWADVYHSTPPSSGLRFKLVLLKQ